MTAILQTEGLRYVYGAGTPFETVAISDAEISIFKGETLGIIGHTGSGKSTFIQNLNGLIKPTNGRVLLDGEDINASKQSGKRARERIGLVFQYPEYQLFEETIYRDIAFGPSNMGLSETEIDARVRRACEFVDIPESLFECSPLELSGGQKRRVAIAGVIAMQPEVLILDEPTAGLDPQGREAILGNILDYKAATGAAIVLVSHSMDDVAKVADRLVVFANSGILMQGKPSEVFAKAELLRSAGLSIPVATKIAIELRKQGISLPEGIFTNEELAEEILKIQGAGPC